MKKAYNIFKKALCLLLTLTLFGGTLCLSSCHGGRTIGEFVLPDGLDPDKSYEISFWAKNDTNMSQVAVYKQAITEFNEYYPNIKVNLKLYTDYGRIYGDVITNIQTGTTPNVCITYPDHIATYKTGQNTVVCLDELINSEKYGLGGSEVLFDAPTKDEIVKKFLSEGVIDGQQYAIPFMRSTEAMYINKTYVERLGYTIPETLTWDFVWEVSAKAAEKDADGNYKVNGQKTMIPFIYKSTDNMMIQMLYQLGEQYTDESGQVLFFDETTESILYTVADSVKAGAFSTFKVSSYPGNFLNAGQCIFAVDSTAGAAWIGSHSPLKDIAEDQIADFETVIMPIPQFDTENPKMISQGPSICIFNKEDPEEVLASWLFTQYLLTDNIQIGYATTEGYLPVTEKVLNGKEYTDYLSREGEASEEYLSYIKLPKEDQDPDRLAQLKETYEKYYYIKIQASKLLLNNIDNTFITPVFNGSASVRNAAGQIIESTVSAVRRGDRIDDAFMKKNFDTASSLYHLDDLDRTNLGAQKEFDSLPIPATVLICSIVGIWLCIGAYVGYEYWKKRRKK